MSTNKILNRQSVVTKGAAACRVVLDFDACLVYAYHNPERVLAYYEPRKGWIVTKKPYYSQGGWGNPSTGDSEGYRLGQNTRDVLRSIGATVLELNAEEFITNAQARELNQAIAKHNRLAKKQTAILKSIGHNKVFDKQYISRIPKFELRTIERSDKLKGIDPIETANKYVSALDTFLNKKGKTVKIDQYVINTNVVTQSKKTVAFRDSQGQVFLNSEMLNITTFEREFLGGQSIIQKTLREVAKYSIPFNVLDSAGLRLNQTKVLEQGPESDHTLNNNETRHFTGALLLENAGRKFLMDIDRQEIKFGIFNAFFVETSSKVTTIAEAYESMKPQDVKDAESQGIEVKRQGEWFFIATGETLTVPEQKILRWDSSSKERKVVLRHDIAHGKGRPNSLYKPVGFGSKDKLVCGTVTHSGREHKDLDLGQTKNKDNTVTFELWKVVPNTTVGNFTIKGDID